MDQPKINYFGNTKALGTSKYDSEGNQVRRTSVHAVDVFAFAFTHSLRSALVEIYNNQSDK